MFLVCSLMRSVLVVPSARARTRAFRACARARLGLCPKGGVRGGSPPRSFYSHSLMARSTRFSSGWMLASVAASLFSLSFHLMVLTASRISRVVSSVCWSRRLTSLRPVPSGASLPPAARGWSPPRALVGGAWSRVVR